MFQSRWNPDPSTGWREPPSTFTPDLHRPTEHDGELRLHMGMIVNELTNRMLDELTAYEGSSFGTIGVLAHIFGPFTKENATFFEIVT